MAYEHLKDIHADNVKILHNLSILQFCTDYCISWIFSTYNVRIYVKGQTITKSKYLELTGYVFEFS